MIRSSDDAAAAKERLISIFELSPIQAQYILDTPLRRLTKYDKLELEREQQILTAEIAELTEILDPSRSCASWSPPSWPPSPSGSAPRAGRCCSKPAVLPRPPRSRLR